MPHSWLTAFSHGTSWKVSGWSINTKQRIDIDDGALVVRGSSPDEGRYRVGISDVWTWRGGRLGVKPFGRRHEPPVPSLRLNLAQTVARTRRSFAFLRVSGAAKVRPRAANTQALGSGTIVC